MDSRHPLLTVAAICLLISPDGAGRVCLHRIRGFQSCAVRALLPITSSGTEEVTNTRNTLFC
jgi:hypothetical protein